MHRAAALKILSDETVPDTVYVAADESFAASGQAVVSDVPVSGKSDVRRLPEKSVSAGNARQQVPGKKTVIARKQGVRPEVAAAVAAAIVPRTYENFRFNPNVVSVNDLRRLGFSLKQAESIDNYRKKGGRFRRKEDFAKSYVVEDSVYRRLEKYIDIPLLDINRADSAEFDALPGIGGYFAAKMVEYRSRLGGYSCKDS